MHALAELVRAHKRACAAAEGARAAELCLTSNTVPAPAAGADAVGGPSPLDEYKGDRRLRALQRLLARCDERGYQRSRHQLQFHSAFIRSCGRVLFKEDFAVQKAKLMQKHQWSKCPSEVLISTPRRFGKTMSVSMFVAALALSMSVDVVVFSPAKRASRKLLETIRTFLDVTDCSDRITEYNSENLRVQSLTGEGSSLIRSFPSRVGVRPPRLERARLSFSLSRSNVEA